MQILFDIGHPAHVHFFRNPIRQLTGKGHKILVTSRDKEVTHQLLDSLSIPHISLTSQADGSAALLFRELLVRDYRLYRKVREFRPDIMAGIGGIFIAHVGAVTGIPSLVFYDTENARLQNAMTYPLASRVIVPRCYEGWVPEHKTVRYPGYHELSYLRPGYFTPDRETAVRNGLAAEGDSFLIRLVSWKASHDLEEHGWDHSLLDYVVKQLAAQGRVIISSEQPLPATFREYNYRGDPAALHHVMAFCRGLIGESATMASECAVLGVPSVYAAQTGRGYTNEQESRYGLVQNVRSLDRGNLQAALDWVLGFDRNKALEARTRLLSETIDVAHFVVAYLESYPVLPPDILVPGVH